MRSHISQIYNTLWLVDLAKNIMQSSSIKRRGKILYFSHLHLIPELRYIITLRWQQLWQWRHFWKLNNSEIIVCGYWQSRINALLHTYYHIILIFSGFEGTLITTPYLLPEGYFYHPPYLFSIFLISF